MTGRHHDSLWLAGLATEAAAQRDRRAAAYPDMVKGRRIDAETAERDWQAWCAIASWRAGAGLPAWATIVWPDPWGALVEAARRALDTGRKAAAAKTDPAERAATEARAAIIEAIAAALAAHRGWLAALNRDLRARAGRDREGEPIPSEVEGAA